MSRWNEMKYSLALNILFPRLCLFVLLPCLILALVPAPPTFPWLLLALQPGYVKGVLAVSLLLFGLSVTANLKVSRYLRLHQRESSPYTYAAWYDPSRRSRYFRIQVADKAAFHRLLRDLRREHPGEAIWLWLWLDDLLIAPPLLLLSLFALVFMLVPWLIRFLWGLLRSRKPHPT